MEKKNNRITMTQAEWDSIHNDFKTVIMGARFLMTCKDDVGSTLEYVQIVKEAQPTSYASF